MSVPIVTAESVCNTSLDKNDELEEKVNQLQSERLNSRTESRRADQIMPPQVTQSAESAEQRASEETASTSELERRSSEVQSSRESFILSGDGNDHHHKSTKFPNLSIFIETSESI